MTHNRVTIWICLVAGLSLFAASAPAAEWGSIKGHFVVDGTPPAQPPLRLTDDYCIKLNPPNKSLVVDTKGDLANAVVFIRVARNEKIDVHPDYAAELAKPVVLDNKGCEFHPHVTLVRVGQKFVVKNSDPMGHNTKWDLAVNGSFNQIIEVGKEVSVTFAKPEANAAPVHCSIHAFMEGQLLVQDHPYMAVSGDDGTFEIKNIPAGKHSFQFWHEKGYLSDLKLKGGTTDRRGRADITIKAGETLDLGDLKVPAAMLH